MEKNILIQKMEIEELKSTIQQTVSDEFTRLKSEFEQ
jgi:hypothetical protein